MNKDLFLIYCKITRACGIFYYIMDNYRGYLSIGTLSKSTTSMADGLEIGAIAELYLAEGNYALALEKFQSCLGILVPLLRKEPPGRRRDLLHKQVINSHN